MATTNQSEKYIRAIGGGNGMSITPPNTPTQYADRQHEYFARNTKDFIATRAKYSSDFVSAEVQGIIPNDFYTYITTFLRFSDVVSQTASSTKNVDDYKLILFQEPSVDYFPIGAKIKCMGSTWICTNPSNISSVHSTAIVQRCNATYSLYDYYGNIVTEPLIIEKSTMSSNDNHVSENLVTMEGYFAVTCQLNQYTKLLNQNKRMILGSKAYYITGFTDFIQEFTGDYESVHLLRFTIRIEEPTDDDDLVNRIAGGKNNTFTAEVSGTPSMIEGDTATLTAHFVKNGTEVESTTDYPVTWQWVSSDTAVATVDSATGVVTAVGAGDTVITATMAQNTGVTANFSLSVAELSTTPAVAFVGVVAQSITQYTSATLTAGYYEDGALTAQTVTWTFSGANEDSYSVATDEESGNSVEITCLRADNTPLTVTATYGTYSVSAQIKLRAY